MNITIYTTTNCVQCDQTKRILNKANVDYTEVDLDAVENNDDIRYLFLERDFKSAPVVITDNDEWSGFRLEKLKKLIAHIEAERAKHVELK